tara:strand:+ start:1718 stop:2116 length:399 start_codon:yes stop_codon:yes gene_type:complete
MNLSEVELPSNRKFGFFFTGVFGVVATYLYITKNTEWSYIFGSISLGFLTVTIINANLLLSLNKLWIRFGLLLGMIVSPIILGVIFFGLFTPIAIIMRLSRRDELRLNFNKKSSHWILRSEPIKSESFKQQF